MKYVTVFPACERPLGVVRGGATEWDALDSALGAFIDVTMEQIERANGHAPVDQWRRYAMDATQVRRESKAWPGSWKAFELHANMRGMYIELRDVDHGSLANLRIDVRLHVNHVSRITPVGMIDDVLDMIARGASDEEIVAAVRRAVRDLMIYAREGGDLDDREIAGLFHVNYELEQAIKCA